MLKIRQIAEQENTSIRTVYRWLAVGLVHYNMPGGIKVAEADLQAFKEEHKCQFGLIKTEGGTSAFSEGESAFIESARKRRRGGTQKTGKRKSAVVSILPQRDSSPSER